MQRTPCTRALGAGLLALGIAALAAQPASAMTFTYRLHNHPDGGAADPLYGLRLDELFDVSKGHDIFTFDFDHSDAAMWLVYDNGGTIGDAFTSDDRIHIFGTVFGGLDTGQSYGHPDYAGLWSVDFTYNANVETAGASGNNLKVNPESLANNGWITPLFDVGGAEKTNDPIALVDEDGGKGYSFKFNNTDDHRLGGSGLSGPGTYAGWGWLNHGGDPHVAASDWLFTGEEAVPEPATMALLLMGLAGGGAAVRRRKK